MTVRMTRSTIGRTARGALWMFTSALLVAQAGSAEVIAGWNGALRSSQPAAAAELAEGGISVETQLVANGFNSPVDIAHADDGSNRLFVVEQRGIIKIIEQGAVLPDPFLNIDPRVGFGSERGLLGLTFSPDYDVDGFFYVHYTNNSGSNVISRFSVSLVDPNEADENSEVILKTIAQPFPNHNGGDLSFSPIDGMLYSGIGDGGDVGDPGNRAQNLQLLLGKMIRLDVDNPPTYIPADNPYVGNPNVLDEIWSFGVRNPWRFSFDRDSGDMLIADVGQFTREEVNFQPAASTGRENWGWKILEGTFCHFNVPAGACFKLINNSERPRLQYDHTFGRCSVTGGFRYRGAAHPDLEGIYFYGDYCTGEIFAGTETLPMVWSSEVALDTNFLITTFGEDEAGELYVADQIGGAVYRIASTAPAGIPCEDVDRLEARCVSPGAGSNRLQARVFMTDTSHDGESVTIGVDGAPNVVTIADDLASLLIVDATSGAHTVSLDDPPSCVVPVVVNCP